MGLTSEQVHWIFGAALAAGATILILRAMGRISGQWVDFLVPTLLGLFGVELLLDPLVHGTAAPGGYAKETAQHFALGGVLIAAAVAELVRVRRQADSFLWRLPLAAALMIAAGVFIFHAQHDANVSMLLMMTQHRVIGATLLTAALAEFLHASDEAGTARRSLAFPLLILLLGAEFLIYTEGGSLFGPASSSVSMHGGQGS